MSAALVMLLSLLKQAKVEKGDSLSVSLLLRCCSLLLSCSALDFESVTLK